MTPLEGAWLAGIIEGEGCIDSRNGIPRIRIKMTDADIITRARVLIDGTMYEDNWNARHYGHKPSWVTQVTGAKAAAAIEAVLPYLGARRTLRATDILLAYRKKRP